MVNSILDTDLYKLTMQKAVVDLFPDEEVKYEFFNRGDTQFPRGFGNALKKEINKFKNIRLTPEEKQFLKEKCPYFNSAYLDYLEKYRFEPDNINIKQTAGKLSIIITGPWKDIILWETPLMATISELYFRKVYPTRGIAIYEEKLFKPKFEALNNIGIKFSDFGTRRRFSSWIHQQVIKNLIKYSKDSLIGTSNVFFAKEFNLNPIGTQAHEWYMFHAAKYGFTEANRLGILNWIKIYGNDFLSIALTDTFTTKAFLEHTFCCKDYAEKFNGVRQDSGDPIKYIDMVVKHYNKLDIDTKTKTIIFSDSINSIDLIKKIHKHCQKKNINDSYGIGTWLTNDLQGIKPLNMVIKMTGLALTNRPVWIPTIKLSDVLGKNTGDEKTIIYCKAVLNIKEE